MFEVENLEVSYGQSRVIHGISFRAEKNETLAIMGRNGMGKTTLFKSLMGILPSSSSKAVVDGENLQGIESHQRVARGLAYVPQGRMIFPFLTVEQNIRAVLDVVEPDRRKREESLEQKIELLDMKADQLEKRGKEIEDGKGRIAALEAEARKALDEQRLGDAVALAQDGGDRGLAREATGIQHHRPMFAQALFDAGKGEDRHAVILGAHARQRI